MRRADERVRLEQAACRILGAVSGLLACLLSACAESPPPAYVRLDGRAPAIENAPGPCLLVSFWATWCPPCREETEALLALATDAPDDLRVLVVSQDTDMAPVEDFLGGPPDPGLHLRLDPGERLADAFGVEVLPTTILVVEGQLVARFEGPRRWDAPEVRGLLARLMGEVRAVDNEGSRH